MCVCLMGWRVGWGGTADFALKAPLVRTSFYPTPSFSQSLRSDRYHATHTQTYAHTHCTSTCAHSHIHMHANEIAYTHTHHTHTTHPHTHATHTHHTQIPHTHHKPHIHTTHTHTTYTHTHHTTTHATHTHTPPPHTTQTPPHTAPHPHPHHTPHHNPTPHTHDMKIATECQQGSNWSLGRQANSHLSKSPHVMIILLFRTSILVYCISLFYQRFVFVLFWGGFFFFFSQRNVCPKAKNGYHTHSRCA